MNLFYNNRLFLLLALLLISYNCFASHAGAIEITYAYTGTGNIYLVTLKFYRDCSGSVTMGNSQTIEYESSSCGYSSSASLSLVSGGSLSSGNYVEVEQPCLSDGVLTTCEDANSPYIGLTEFIFEGTVILPYQCDDWLFYYDGCCRNYAISTIDNPGSKGYFVGALLNSKDAPDNNSPVFQGIPVPQLCIGNEYKLSQEVLEVDGDSLYFSLVAAEEDPYPGTSMVNDYLSPYSPGYPISSTGGSITIDSKTGVISMKPNLEQIGIICVLVEEFRYDSTAGIWNKIGSIKRDMQVVVIANCKNDLGSFEFGESLLLDEDSVPTSSLVLNCMDSTFSLLLQDSFQIQCHSISETGSDFRMEKPDGTPLPIKTAEAINCFGGYSSGIQFELHEPLDVNGTYYMWTKIGYDQNTLLSYCGMAISEFDTMEITVENCPELSMDLQNVTVLDNDSTGVLWTAPQNSNPLAVGWDSLFVGYDIYRGLLPDGYYTYTGSTYSMEDTTFVDHDVEVTSFAYNYKVAAVLSNDFQSPFTDTIQSILLSCGESSSDSTKIEMNWTPYWGWDNAEYTVYHSVTTGGWTPIGTTSDTKYTFAKPLDAFVYQVKVITTHKVNTTKTLSSESNWCNYEIPYYEVDVPNSFTPNGDGYNDNLTLTNIEQHPENYLIVYNRWGRKVFEANDYINDWDGGKLSEGTYFYILTYDDVSINGTFTIIR